MLIEVLASWLRYRMKFIAGFLNGSSGCARGGLIARSVSHVGHLFCSAVLTLTLAGCGSTGSETAALALTPVPEGKARVTITRTSSLMYAGAPATITLNGQTVASIATGGSTIVDVPAGANILAASAWSYPGQFSVKLNAAPGQKYALEVSPRSASLGPGMLLGPIGGAIDASVNENAGAFEMKFVAKPQPSGTVAEANKKGA